VAWVKASLERPSHPRRPNETYEAHAKRLSKVPKVYEVAIQSVNAAEFGAPQNRRRILFLGVRADAGFPPPLLKRTHTRERLIYDQFVTGEYWKRHGLKRSDREPLVQPGMSLVARVARAAVPPPGLPWVTARDVIAGLGEPNGKDCHVFQPGARIYQGHTGSPLDLPAKALKAGDHGVPGGENMLLTPKGGIRYFTVRESARLQTFPDNFIFHGSWSETMRQLGNAVPVKLAHLIGEDVARRLGGAA